MALRPGIPQEALHTFPRFAVVTSLSGDLDVRATYGAATRAFTVLGSGGDLVVDQDSPYDDTGLNDTQTLPGLWQGYSEGLAIRKIKSTTTALPILLKF